MPNFYQNKESEVGVEELLQLKRCEKPKKEFWDKFDRELKTKQLQAIVHSRSSMKSFFLRFKTSWSLSLPLVGAAAFATAIMFNLDFFQFSQQQKTTDVYTMNTTTALFNEVEPSYVTGELPEVLDVQTRDYTQVASNHVLPSNHQSHVQFVASSLNGTRYLGASRTGFY